MGSDPGEVLSEARTAFKNNDYPTALEKYQWFYDNALDIDRSYYGVRLSYCLGEWAELGKEFPEAMESLINLKESTLLEFSISNSRQAFHEFASICKYLDCQKEVFEQFQKVHNTDKDLSEKIFRFIYEYCASNEMWEICREYIGNGYEQYKKAIEKFDHIRKFAEEKTADVGDSIFKHEVESLKREILWILDMLHFINSPGEYESAMSKIESDLKERGREDIYREICESAPDKGC